MNRIWMINFAAIFLLRCGVWADSSGDYAAEANRRIITDRAFTIAIAFSIGPFPAAQCPHNYSYFLEFRSNTVAARRSAIQTPHAQVDRMTVERGSLGSTFSACYDAPESTDHREPSMLLTESELNSPGAVFTLIAYRSNDSSRYGGTYQLTDDNKRVLTASDNDERTLDFVVGEGDAQLDTHIAAKLRIEPIVASPDKYAVLTTAVTFARQVQLSDELADRCVQQASWGTPCYLAMISQRGIQRTTSVVPVTGGAATWDRDEVIDIRRSYGPNENLDATTYRIALTTVVPNELTIDESSVWDLATCSVTMSTSSNYGEAPYPLQACRSTVSAIKEILVQTSVYQSTQATESPVLTKPQAAYRSSK